MQSPAQSGSERQLKRGSLPVRKAGSGTASEFLGLVRRVAQLDLLDGGIHQ